MCVSNKIVTFVGNWIQFEKHSVDWIKLTISPLMPWPLVAVHFKHEINYILEETTFIINLNWVYTIMLSGNISMPFILDCNISGWGALKFFFLLWLVSKWSMHVWKKLHVVSFICSKIYMNCLAPSWDLPLSLSMGWSRKNLLWT